MIVLRIAFLVCVGLIVAVRPEANRTKLLAYEQTDFSSRISAALATQGLTSWSQKVIYEVSLRAQVVKFQPYGCHEAAKVIPFNITLNSDAFLVMNEVHEWPTKMVHLDQTSPHLSQARLLVGFLQAILLDALGLKPTQGSRTALIIAAPPGCESAFDVDLRAVWESEA